MYQQMEVFTMNSSSQKHRVKGALTVFMSNIPRTQRKNFTKAQEIHAEYILRKEN